ATRRAPRRTLFPYTTLFRSDRCERDFLGTIREMAEIGYQFVEFAGFYGASVREVRRALEAAGIGAVSAHIGLNLKKGEPADLARSEEHTSELQSRENLVCRL